MRSSVSGWLTVSSASSLLSVRCKKDICFGNVSCSKVARKFAYHALTKPRTETYRRGGVRHTGRTSVYLFVCLFVCVDA